MTCALELRDLPLMLQLCLFLTRVAWKVETKSFGLVICEQVQTLRWFTQLSLPTAVDLSCLVAIKPHGVFEEVSGLTA